MKIELKKEYLISIFLFIASSIIGSTIFVYSWKELYSGYLDKNEKKYITEDNNEHGSFMLSYGPYHKLASGNYFVILSYKTDTNRNTYKLYSDNGGIVLNEGYLPEKTGYVIKTVKQPNVKLQVLTYFDGEGMLQINSIIIIPIWFLCLWGINLLLLIAYLIVKKGTRAIIKYFNFGFGIVLFAASMFYIDNSPDAALRSLFASALLFCGISSCMFLLFDKFQKREVLFLGSMITCWFVEWRNVINYNFEYMVLYLTILLTFCIYAFIYLIIKKRKLYYILLSIMTLVFALYSVVQYTYYCYFKDLFTVKIVRLLFTAAEATSSIQELITDKVLIYLGIMVGYIILLVVVLLSNKLSGIYDKIIKTVFKKKKQCNC